MPPPLPRSNKTCNYSNHYVKRAATNLVLPPLDLQSSSSCCCRFMSDLVLLSWLLCSACSVSGLSVCCFVQQPPAPFFFAFCSRTGKGELKLALVRPTRQWRCLCPSQTILRIPMPMHPLEEFDLLCSTCTPLTASALPHEAPEKNERERDPPVMDLYPRHSLTHQVIHGVLGTWIRRGHHCHCA
jgi:hypothetical protein